MNKLVPAAALAAATLLAPLAAHAQATTITDNAGNYSGGYDGDNAAPAGFGTFNVTADGGPTGYAGTFLGSSGSAGYNIDSTDGNSFGLYANTDPAATVTITRSFATPLQNAGDAFSLQLRTNFFGGAAGQTFSYLIGPDTLTLTSAGYTLTGEGGSVVTNTLTGNDYILDADFTVGPADSYTFVVQGNNPLTDAATATGTFTSPITDFAVMGTYMPQNQYFNNLSVTNVAAAPEPSSVAAMLIGIAALGGLVAFRRRQAV